MGKIKVYFFRHGITTLNEKGHMCGRYNALVSENGWNELRRLKANYEYPQVEKVYCSPAIRCRETASVLFPDQTPELVENFWEMNFGEMEDVWVGSLAGQPVYQKWMSQDPDFAFPGGETNLEARFRVLAAMTHVIQDCVDRGLKEVAVVAHGKIFGLLLSGTLITDEPAEAFKLCPNGMGYAVTLDPEEWFGAEQQMIFEGFYPEGAERPKAEDSPYFANFNCAETKGEKETEIHSVITE